MIKLNIFDKWLHKEKPKPTGSVAIEMGQSGMALSRVVSSGDQLLCPLCMYTHDVTKEDFATSLKAVTEQSGLQGSDCHWVLHSNDYRVLLIDRPQVPETEYTAAAQWLIKDLIDYPVESAVLDTFLPSSQIPGQDNKLYVVVAQREYLASFKAIIDQAGLNVVSITIKEMAMRNVLSLCGDEPTALLQVDQSRSSLLVVENKQITMMRTINVGLNQLNDPQSGVTPILEEVERSVKYYTQQLRQSAPKVIYHTPLPAEASAVSNGLAEAKITPLDLRRWLTFSDDIQADAINEAFSSIGANFITETV